MNRTKQNTYGTYVPPIPRPTAMYHGYVPYSVDAYANEQNTSSFQSVIFSIPLTRTTMHRALQPTNTKIPMEYDGDEDLFPLLRSITEKNPGNIIRSIKPSDLDQLVIEQRRVFERCTIPESFISKEEREVDELMVQCLGNVDFTLEILRSSANTSMLDTYRRSAGMPENLELLLKMSDPFVRTGKVRCHAIWHLCKIIMSVRSVWRTKLPSKRNFQQELIKTFAFIVDPTKNKPCHHAEDGCSCEGAWSMLCRVLTVCQDPPPVIIDLLSEYNWYAVFELNGANAPVAAGGDSISFNDVTLFVCVHRWPIRLIQQDHDSKRALEFLAKMGTCHRFFRRTVERIAKGKMWSKDHEAIDKQNASGMEDDVAAKKSRYKVRKPRGSTRMDDMGPFLSALHCYTSTLTPVLPKNMSEESRDELDSLVARGYRVLTKAKMAALEHDIPDLDPNSSTVLQMNENVNLLSDYAWTKLKVETDADRWYRFEFKHLGTSYSAEDLKKSWRGLATTIKDEEFNFGMASELKEHNMCANCSTLESSLETKLLKCSGCRQILYCSAKCQRHHWKKLHKKQCQQKFN